MSTKKPKPTSWRAAAKAVPDVPTQPQQVAPWPLLDRWPNVLGQNLNHAYISAAMRSATQGYRQQFVDVLDELLEREPFGYACLAWRILTTAGARKHVRAAKTKEGDTANAELAEKARALVEAQLEAIPNLTQHCATLLWAIYYGIMALEKMWERVDRHDASWWIKDLHFVHSRRLAYPNLDAWRLHIWDQGAVNISEPMTHPTEGLYGLAVDDYPHKFVVHTAQLRGDYPTREGLGRELVFWFSLKGMASRSAAQNVERFAKPWAWSTFNTGTPEQGKPRVATDEDIAAGDAAIKALGIGALAGASLPDSIAVNLKFPDSTTAIGHKDFLAYCDAMIAACIRGNTNTANMGKSGSRAALEVQNTDEMQTVRYDAVGLGCTLTEHIAKDVIALNMPEALHVVPIIEVAVEEEPDPEHIASVLQKAVMAGVPVDADAIAAMMKLPLVPNDTKGPDGKPMPRRCVPLKPLDLGATEGVSDADADRGKTAEQGKQPQDGAEPADKKQPDKGDDAAE